MDPIKNKLLTNVPEDTYHGVIVPDPYRRLENVESRQVKNWLKRQNRNAGKTIGKDLVNPIRKYLRKLSGFQRLSDYPGMSFENSGRQNQSVLYSTLGKDGERKIAIDQNRLSPDGSVAITTWLPSPDYRLLAYATVKNESDFEEWHLFDLENNSPLPDCLRGLNRFSPVWAPDGKGIYYSAFAEDEIAGDGMESNASQRAYFHAVGTEQSDDTLVYESKSKRARIMLGESDDGENLCLNVWDGYCSREKLLVKNMSDPESPAVEIFDEEDVEFAFAGSYGSTLYFHTELAAPLCRVIAVDASQTANPSESTREIVPEWDLPLTTTKVTGKRIVACYADGPKVIVRIHEPDGALVNTFVLTNKGTIESVSLVQERLIFVYLEHAASKIKVYDLEGNLICRPRLRGMGTVETLFHFSCETYTYFAYETFALPRTVYRLNMKTGRINVHWATGLPFNPEDFVTRRVFYKSKDGTKIPMFISHKRALKPNATTPCVLEGYGGFGRSSTPEFAVENIAWMEMGGIYAVACIRGGGEYGPEWHAQGKQEGKQTSFDDFISASEWLIRRKYTCAAKLAITGGSNGGLVVAASLTQRPELFGAVIARAGIYDMLRFTSFSSGWESQPEYGSPDQEEEFKDLHKISPVHNAKPGNYPAVLITAGEFDSRVFPAHSYKFAAALQDAQNAKAPILLSVLKNAGHGTGRCLSKILDDSSLRLAFLAHVFAMCAPNGKAK